jgi:phosphoglycolate phosphatase
MKNVKHIVFDFDGTIADSLYMILEIYNRIAHEYGLKLIEKDDREQIRSQKPQTLLKAYGVSNLKLLKLLLRIRKEIGEHISEIKLVKDMGPSLNEIKNAGFRLGILTSNSRKNVRIFLEKESLSGIIDFIYSGRSLLGKDKVIKRMLERKNISHESVIYVGDETRDTVASKKAGIPVIAVSWGLSRRDALASLMPDQIADDPKELFECVQRIFRG